VTKSYWVKVLMQIDENEELGYLRAKFDMAASWDSLRRQTRECENSLEQQLTMLSKLAATVSTSYSSSGVLPHDSKQAYSDQEREVDAELAKLTNLVDAMIALLDSTADGVTTAMKHTATRHRDILADYTKDFKRTKSSLREAEQRANLLGSVREEISAFKASTSSSTSEQLLAERSKIDSSHRMADEVLGQAFETRYEFQRQRSTLTSVSSRMGGVLSQVPGINSLIGMINSRRRRDSVILGSVICACVVVLLWWITR